jgi:hypothetical protein
LCLREEIEAGLPAAVVYEIRRRVLRRRLAAEILEELKQHTVVIAVVDTRGRRRRLEGYRPLESARPLVPPHFLANRRTAVRNRSIDIRR